MVADLKQNTRVDKERHKREHREKINKLYIKRREAYKHVLTRWGNIIDMFKNSRPMVVEEK